MQRYWIVLIVAACLTAGCQGDRKTAAPAEEAPADSSASADTTASASVAEDEMEVIAEEPMPKAADELFDDFIFNFAANKRLQYSRIKFPLPVVSGGTVELLPKNQWEMENFFMRQDYYTLIFDSEKQVDEVKQTAIAHAVVEKIYLHEKTIRQYVFDRIGGQWMMQKIVNLPLAESDNASFLEFYQHFATSDDFQSHHLCPTVHFETTDPDDDFSQMEGVITPDTWPAFAPELPSDMIYNIVYGKTHPSGKCKVFVIRGIANGLETELTFRLEDGQWMLSKLST